MKRPVQVMALIATTMIMCKTPDFRNQLAPTILLDGEYLSLTKERIEKNDSNFMLAFHQLINDAEVAMKEGPYSVTDKEKLPPSGDRHDYASYSRYWWPDPNQPDGLPYIRRDGETNPESQNLKSADRKRIGAFGKNTETLGLAYYFTGKEKYATKAAELLRVWFLDEETFMNPNVNHAQCRPGHNEGSKSGILDGRILTKALEGSLLISGSSALTSIEREELKSWAKSYFDWLTTNKMALAEAASKNNHGSYYDAQAMYFALYSDDKAAAKRIAQNFVQNRMPAQIRPDGSMPEEMARTRPLFYSIYNLHAMFLVAQLAEKVGVDVWEAGSDNSILRAGLDYLAPYADEEKSWPQPTLGNCDRMELYPILMMAEKAYPDRDYLQNIDELPSKRRSTNRSNLTLLQMR